MSLAQEWSKGYFVKFIAPVLSHMIFFELLHSSNYLIHRSCAHGMLKTTNKQVFSPLKSLIDDSEIKD